jgi:DNA primase
MRTDGVRSRSGDAGTARLDGVAIRHADKLWWPGEGITKGEVARFYADRAPRVLPWMKDRPLVAERCPDGMRGECFFQKNFTRGLPDDVRRVGVHAGSTGKTVQRDFARSPLLEAASRLPDRHSTAFVARLTSAAIGGKEE